MQLRSNSNHAILFLSITFFVRFGSGALEDIQCQNELMQRQRTFTKLAFYSGISPERRRQISSYLTALGAPSGLARLFETPEPLEYPITTAECLAAASLIPDSVSLDTHKPGHPVRFNLLYSNTQRQNII